MSPLGSEGHFASDNADYHQSTERSALLGAEDIRTSDSAEEDEDHARELASWKGLPWWRRPSPYWLIFGITVGAMGVSSLLAPKVALYTTLVCRARRPEYVTDGPAFTLIHDPLSITAGVSIPHISDGNGPAVDTVFTLLPSSTYTAPSNHVPNGSGPDQLCASDPDVQAVVAKLNAVFITFSGILSCITTGWWGSLSDRYGRRIVILVSVFGLFATDFIHVITAWFADVLPGGYWFILVGYLIEGLCGSVSTGVAINHAFLADTTHASMRSQYFSLSFGFEFAGVAIGPVLGGLLIRLTGNLLSVFYFASVLHGAYAVFLFWFLPESLTRARVRGARLRWRQERKNARTSGGLVVSVLGNVTRFFSPLVVLLPQQLSNSNPLERRRKDWSLFFITVAYGLGMSVLGSLSYKFQYAAARFHWTPEVTSYYVSTIGATRAFFLAAILPMILKYLAPTAIQVPASVQESPLHNDNLPSSDTPNQAQNSSQTHVTETPVPVARSVTFDLALARASVALEATAFLGMASAGTGALFTLASIFASFSAGFPPSAQALALYVFTNRRAQNQGEVGKLFGALSVVQALGGQIVSPALYGFVYSNTVAIFPQAIMFLSTCTSLLAFTFLLFVRITPPKQPAQDEGILGPENEQAGDSI